MAASNSKQQAQLVINDGAGLACEHCKKMKEDVFALTVGEAMFFVSQECLMEAASHVIETGELTILVS